MGSPRIYWPLTVSASNNKLDFQVPSGTPRVATLTNAVYYSPTQLLNELKTRMDAGAGGAGTFTCTFNTSTGKVTIACTANFKLMMVTGPNFAASIHQLIGYNDQDTAAAASHTSIYQMKNAWFADTSYLVRSDTGDLPKFTQAMTVAESGKGKSIRYSTVYQRTVALQFLKPYKMYSAVEGVNAHEAIERLLIDGYARFRFWNTQSDVTNGNSATLTAAEVAAGVQDYFLDLDAHKELPFDRLQPGKARYSWTLKLRRRVA